MNVLNATKLCTLKWLILCNEKFTLTKKEIIKLSSYASLKKKREKLTNRSLSIVGIAGKIFVLNMS